MCRELFTFTRRRHHCRRCGRCVCSKCSGNRRVLPFHQDRSPTSSSGQAKAERVCDTCVELLDRTLTDDDLGGGPLTELMLRRAARELHTQLPEGEGWGSATCPRGHSMCLEVAGIPTKDGKPDRPERYECKRCHEWMRGVFRCSDCRWNACRTCYIVLRWRIAIPADATVHIAPDFNDGDPGAASTGDLAASWYSQSPVMEHSQSRVSTDSAPGDTGLSVEWLPQQTPDFFPCALPSPPWVPDSVSDLCAICEALFSITRRKHHCRGCGRCICNDCSRSRHPLPELGKLDQVRLCSDCAGLAQMGGFDLWC